MLPEPIFSARETSPLHAEHKMLVAEEHMDPSSIDEHSDSDDWVPRGMSLAELEREIIEVAMRRSNGSVTEAANHLGVSPSTLYRKRAAWDKD
jgi:DNA-binding NtrC family response regulator